jgi:hypothetical protein
MTSFVVRMRRSALPFCGDVCRQESRKETPFALRKDRKAVLMNSPRCHIVSFDDHMKLSFDISKEKLQCGGSI